MLKPSKMRWVIITVCLTCSLTTFISGLMMGQLLKDNKNLLKMIKLSGIGSIVAAIASLILCHIIQHKLIIAISSVLGGIIVSISYFLYEPVERNEDILMLTHLVAYGFHTLALFTIWNMTPRVFPTEMRGEGTGVAIAIGELNFSFARLLLPSIYNKLPIFLTTLWCCIIVIVLCCFVLLSVHKRELPDMIDDAVKFRNTCKPTRWSTLRATSPTLDETEVKIVDFERETSLSLRQPNVPNFSKFRKNKTQELGTSTQ